MRLGRHDDRLRAAARCHESIRIDRPETHVVGARLAGFFDADFGLVELPLDGNILERRVVRQLKIKRLARLGVPLKTDASAFILGRIWHRRHGFQCEGLRIAKWTDIAIGPHTRGDERVRYPRVTVVDHFH